MGQGGQVHRFCLPRWAVQPRQRALGLEHPLPRDSTPSSQGPGWAGHRSRPVPAASTGQQGALWRSGSGQHAHPRRSLQCTQLPSPGKGLLPAPLSSLNLLTQGGGGSGFLQGEFCLTLPHLPWCPAEKGTELSQGPGLPQLPGSPQCREARDLPAPPHCPSSKSVPVSRLPAGKGPQAAWWEREEV